MILESVPHALSILYATCGMGTLDNLTIHHPDEEQMTLHADYRSRHARWVSLCQVQGRRGKGRARQRLVHERLARSRWQ